MKVLEILENKLRYKNYSDNTIKVYKQTLSQYLGETGCKDPYKVSTKDIVNYLELKHKAILTLTYSTGMRVSEVINLKITDIDSKRMLIHIKNAKGNKDRIVPLSHTVLILLREYFKEYKPKEYLFNGQSNLKYSTRSCNEIVKKYIGKEYHMPLLRHSNATALLEAETDIRIIQKHLGHSSTKTTEIYTHVSTNLLNKIKLPI